MEHKGGRIKDHISREKHPGQDDWMDVEWLDDGDDEPFEIEDWRDEENWNLDQNKEEPSAPKETEQAAQPVPDRVKGETRTRSTQGRSGERTASGKRPVSAGAGRPGNSSRKRPESEAGKRPERTGGKRAGAGSPDNRQPAKKRPTGERQENQENQKQRQKKQGSAARPVKAAGRAAGKAGKTAGKAVGKGVSIVLKCGCFAAMAVIVLKLWEEFWAERNTLGEIWRVAADRNYAEALYLGIAGFLLLFGVISAIWLLGGKKMPDGNRLRSYDTGRGLVPFILYAILAAAAGFVVPMIPESPQVLAGAKLALEAVDRASRIVLICSAAGFVLCVIRKLIRR